MAIELNYNKRMNNGVIAVDFDGTITTPSPYPITGKIRPECIDILKKLRDKYILILWTCREGYELEEATLMCSKEGIYFDFVNSSPLDRDGYGRKIKVDLFIDDKNFTLNGNSSIDWEQIKNKLLGE